MPARRLSLALKKVTEDDDRTAGRWRVLKVLAQGGFIRTEPRSRGSQLEEADEEADERAVSDAELRAARVTPRTSLLFTSLC